MTLRKTEAPRRAARAGDPCSETPIVPPNAVDVVWRATAIWVTWMKARYGISEALLEVADDPRVQKYLTLSEECYLRDNHAAVERDVAFGSRGLRARTLFWAVGILPAQRPSQGDAEEEMRTAVEGRSPEDLVYEARLRPLPSLVAEAVSRHMDAHLRSLGQNYRPYPAEASAPDAAHFIPLSATVEPCIALGWLLGRFTTDDSPEPEGIR